LIALAVEDITNVVAVVVWAVIEVLAVVVEDITEVAAVVVEDISVGSSGDGRYYRGGSGGGVGS
jgi:hypothetical protein